jgi:exportin-7
VQVGLKIFNQLAMEMNQPTPGRSLTLHRKTAVSFRDTSLFHIFPVALSSLKQLQADPNADARHLEQAIMLALKCLSFDFVGTSLDESTEDPGNVQVPSSWRPLIEDTHTMQLFLDVYAATKPPLSSMALECLTRVRVISRDGSRIVEAHTSTTALFTASLHTYRGLDLIPALVRLFLGEALA